MLSFKEQMRLLPRFIVVFLARARLCGGDLGGLVTGMQRALALCNFRLQSVGADVNGSLRTVEITVRFSDGQTATFRAVVELPGRL